MDPVKVVIFVVAFLLLLLLGRKLASYSESTVPSSLPEQVLTENKPDDEPASSSNPALVGADLPLPIHLPEITRNQDSRYSRPEFYNYYFEKTDLLSGPADPAVFYDHFYLEARDLENNHKILYRYFVATPLGLQKALADGKLSALYLRHHSLIVARWDVPLILGTATKHIIEAYLEDPALEENALPDPDTLD